MESQIRQRLVGRRNGWLRKVERAAAGDQRIINVRMHEIAMDRYTGDPNAIRTCPGCSQRTAGWWEMEHDSPYTMYFICQGCGSISECQPSPEPDLLIEQGAA